MRTTRRIVMGALAAALLAAPAAGRAQGATPPAGQPAGDPRQAHEAIEFVHKWAVRSQAFARLAVEKGTSPGVKQFGQELAKDNEELDRMANELARERGVQLTDQTALLADPEQKQALDALQAHSGAEFDRRLMEAFLGDRERQVDQLKAFRDRTPGKDAKLKGWLDQVEDKMEEHRNDARVALREVRDGQRQGRAPPQ